MSGETHAASQSYASLVDTVAASGLVAAEAWAETQRAAAGDPGTLADELLSRGLLTKFQLAAFLEGRGMSLKVGNYDLLDRLGAGGMGTVFKARHRRMKRIVALKVLSANLSKNPVFVKRFQREVETIACLGHPNVVMAYDADEAEVGHFLVMEFVSGTDLASHVHKYGAMPPALAVDSTLQAARGLAYAHSQGIIHRDVKPHNLLRDEAGVVKVTDLGLARLSHDAEEGPADGGVTMAGGVIGTPEYMSPEQAIDSTTLDPRTDVYSLGCTLYYLLVGHAPYRGANIMAILLQHRDAPIPALSAEVEDVPPALERLYERMMTKDVDLRIGTMTEVVAALEAIAAAFPRTNTSATLDLAAGATVDLGDVGGGPQASTAQLSNATVALEGPPTPLSVLVVEPSRVQASIIKGYLQEQGLNVVGAASNARDALEAVHRHKPRAIVSSMYLADENGLALAAKVRAESPDASPGFVLVATELTEAEATALAKLGRTSSLPKPFTAAQLVAALERAAGAATPAAAVPVGTTAPRTSDRARLRTLIVDDSGVARLNARTVLQQCGLSEFVEVPDGAHAIAVAAREHFDLVVTDYNMPLMDGRALVSYLRQSAATAKIPIVMVTTETDPAKLEAVRRLGVAAILEKAFPVGVVGPLLDVLFP